MQKPLRLSAVTRADRHRMIEAAKDAIGAGGGWILDFRLFSNLSINIVFELPSGRAADLLARLDALDWKFDEDGRNELLACIERGTEVVSHDIGGTLQITFIHDEPDLHIPVPAIPG